jgi:hypothetical protein
MHVIHHLGGADPRSSARYVQLHPSWCAFIAFCEKLKFGELDRLKIQDGLPMMVEQVKKRVRFENGEIDDKE